MKIAAGLAQGAMAYSGLLICLDKGKSHIAASNNHEFREG